MMSALDRGDQMSTGVCFGVLQMAWPWGRAHSLDEVGIERGGMRPAMDGIRHVHGDVRTDRASVHGSAHSPLVFLFHGRPKRLKLRAIHRVYYVDVIFTEKTDGRSAAVSSR